MFTVRSPNAINANGVAGRSGAAEDDPSIGHSLMSDIQHFLQRKGVAVDAKSSTGTNSDDDNTLVDEDENKENIYDEDDDDDDIEDYDSDSWCSLSETDDNNGDSTGKQPVVKNHPEGGSKGSSSRGRPLHHVRFQEDPRRDAMDFSPPRLPKNSPSYLIWSIFTKEREERRRERQKQRKMDSAESSSEKAGRKRKERANRSSSVGGGDGNKGRASPVRKFLPLSETF